MTKNQIAYHTMRENMRHNRVNEVETERNNREYNATRFDKNEKTYYLGQDNLSENIRHNRVSENETRRHNHKDEEIRALLAAAKVVETAVGSGAKIASTAAGMPSSYVASSPSVPPYGEVPF